MSIERKITKEKVDEKTFKFTEKITTINETCFTFIDLAGRKQSLLSKKLELLKNLKIVEEGILEIEDALSNFNEEGIIVEKPNEKTDI